MKKNVSFLLSFSLFFLSLASSVAQNVLVDTKKTYQNIKAIEVNGGWLDVRYQGGTSSNVEVTAYLTSNDNDQDMYLSL